MRRRKFAAVRWGRKTKPASPKRPHQLPETGLIFSNRHNSSSSSSSTKAAVVSSVARRRPNDFIEFPFEKSARPRLTLGRRCLRLLSFTCLAGSLMLTYFCFVTRCLQNGRTLDAATNQWVDWSCVGGVLAAVLLLLLSLAVQLVDKSRHPSGKSGQGGCCSCCGCCTTPVSSSDSIDEIIAATNA